MAEYSLLRLIVRREGGNIVLKAVTAQLGCKVLGVMEPGDSALRVHFEGEEGLTLTELPTCEEEV